MDNTIAVKTKNVYGQDTFYPLNQQAMWLAKLAGTKTLTIEALKVAKQMGFTIHFQTPEIKL